MNFRKRQCAVPGCGAILPHEAISILCVEHLSTFKAGLADTPKTIDEIKVCEHSGVAVKHDQEKPDLSLFSPIWIMGVGRVLSFGAKKYSSHNWRRGFKICRCLAAALRHIFAFIGGEDLDPESGECHLDHASCMIMFARELWQTRPDLDDRYKEEKNG